MYSTFAVIVMAVLTCEMMQDYDVGSTAIIGAISTALAMPTDSYLDWSALVRRRTRLRPSSNHLLGSYTAHALVHCAKRCAVYSHRLLPTTRSRSRSQLEHARVCVLESPFLPFGPVHAVSFSSPSSFTRSRVPTCARGHRDGQLQSRALWTLPDVSNNASHQSSTL